MPRGVPRSGLNPGWFRAGNGKPLTERHRRSIADAQRRAWDTKRKRKPIGSVNLDRYGYVRVKVAERARWPREHALVMEAAIRRKLTPAEVIHHIDGCKTNNHLENLFLCSGHAQHVKIEKSLLAAFRVLLSAGHARFNRQTGEYEALL